MFILTLCLHDRACDSVIGVRVCALKLILCHLAKYKDLQRKVAERSTQNANQPLAVPSPGGEGQGEGQHSPAKPLIEALVFLIML